MKQNGLTNSFTCKKIYTAAVILFLCTLLLCSCAGVSDWTYSDLPGNYEIWRINSNTIVMVKRLDEYTNDSAIDGYVDAFCCNDIYIGVKRLPFETHSDEYPDNVFEMDFSNLEHYIINTTTDEIHGPYTEEEYEARCEELGVGKMCDWIKTYPKPDGAK